MIDKALWLTWENQRRNRELAAAMDLELYEWANIDAINNRIQKYLVGLVRTGWLLVRKRPRLVVCMSPSIILACFLVVVKRLGRFRVFVDTHNAGLRPKEGESTLLNRLALFVVRHADLTIVSNENLCKWVTSKGGRGFTLPDRVPDVSRTPDSELPGKALLFICSYAADEPYEKVFEAARGLEPDMFIYVTGDYKKKGQVPPDLAPNILLTGYLSEDKYLALLNAVDAVVDLTTRENCLVCGAYEAVAAGKPMVLSDTEALRTYFDVGAVYTKHSAEALRESFFAVMENQDKLAKEVVELRTRRETEWEAKKIALVTLMKDTLKAT